MFELILWTAGVYLFLSCPLVFEVFVEPIIMAKHRKKPLVIYQPTVEVERSGYIRAICAAYHGDGDRPDAVRIWRFKREDAEAVLWDIEEFEWRRDAPWLSERACKFLGREVRRVLKEHATVELETRLKWRVVA